MTMLPHPRFLVPSPPLPLLRVRRFGDIGPLSNLARLATLSILVPLFFILLQEVNHLSTIYAAQSKFSKPFEGSPHGHVIVCGQTHVRGCGVGYPGLRGVRVAGILVPVASLEARHVDEGD